MTNIKVRLRRQRHRTPPQRRGQVILRPPDVAVINNTSEEIPAFGVMEVSTYSVEDGQILAVVVKPTSVLKLLYLFNGPEPIAAGDYGGGWWQGRAAYDSSNTPSVGQMWGPGADWLLHQHYPGYLVAGYDEETESLLCRGGGLESILGELDEELSAGSNATMSVFGGAAGSEADIGKTVTVYDDIMETSPSESIQANARCHCSLKNGFFYVDVADECPE